jgi:nifR3 family TIM-barrel protein
VRLGRLEIRPPVILAPMADVTDLPLRTICEELGAGLTVTEFLSAHALAAGAAAIVRRLTASRGGRPFGVQLFGRAIAPMERAAALAVECGAALVDLNMGCPARKVVWGGQPRGGDGVCRGAGVALMLDPEYAARLVAAVRAVVPPAIPVTVKHRAGWDAQHQNAPEFARAMVAAGAAAVTVHGRTKVQGFSGQVDLGIIRAVREALPPEVPVVGNGDVTDVASYLRMRRETGCDAVMIGRAAMTNPWVFALLRAHEEGRPLPPPPTAAEKHRLFLRHVGLCEEIHPESACREARKVLCRYAKGMRGASELRQSVMRADTMREVLDLGARFFAAARPPRAPVTGPAASS